MCPCFHKSLLRLDTNTCFIQHTSRGKTIRPSARQSNACVVLPRSKLFTTNMKKEKFLFLPQMWIFFFFHVVATCFLSFHYYFISHWLHRFKFVSISAMITVTLIIFQDQHLGHNFAHCSSQNDFLSFGFRWFISGVIHGKQSSNYISRKKVSVKQR